MTLIYINSYALRLTIHCGHGGLLLDEERKLRITRRTAVPCKHNDKRHGGEDTWNKTSLTIN